MLENPSLKESTPRGHAEPICVECSRTAGCLLSFCSVIMEASTAAELVFNTNPSANNK